ncbi:hypothetical protein Sru01_41170 [Sphaerisporangium rufum]|uniref:Uncharacterized protein n=1 Tax=Sphaerisporangium rufum TaxID=1381558 RepID=A0A919R6E7_9ACTN|nr:hypothetical protein [Sphaerisporangium rufum]GII79135.1 hypothetical protein Sru01_41170 [Sphaerisporangium rufum]
MTGDEHPLLIVNIVGPLGIGKTRLLTALAGGFVDLGRSPDATEVRTGPARTRPGGLSGGGRAGDGLVPGTPTLAGSAPHGSVPHEPPPLAIDGVDTDRRAAAAARFLDRAGRGRFLVAGRLPLAARPGWTHRAVVTVELRPWAPADIRELAAALGVPGPEAAEQVVRLSGGIPLIAESLCRAFRRATDPGPPGALADLAATEVLNRLATESPGPGATALPVVATVDGADQDLLAALARVPSGAFTRLGRLSVVRPDRHGLTVAEPYRTLLDLAYRWRHPVRRDELAVRGAAHRHRQLARTTDPPLRARLTDQVLYLAGHGPARRDLFTEAAGAFSIRRAGDGDAETIARLIRLWAATEGLAARLAERMRDRWLAGTDHGFHLVVDTGGRSVGMANLTPLIPDGAPALEPLLQQHAGPLLDAMRSGSVVGMMAVEPRSAAAQPVLVRHILRTAVASGGLVVSTPWVPYQRIAARFGLDHLGDTRHDLYRCGRPSALYTRAFTPHDLPSWLRGMQGPHPAAASRPAGLVRDALRDLHRPDRLAASPLHALSGHGPVPLADLLRHAVDALAASAAPADAEAGRILRLYYLQRAGGHDLLAHRLHLSRATYFRRLDHGLAQVTAIVTQALATPGPPG